MKKIIMLILPILFIFSCSFVSPKYSIVGCWKQNEDENVSMIFNKTHLEYFGNDFLYNYKIVNKQLIIMEDTTTVLQYNILRLTNDSLLLESVNEDKTTDVYRYSKVKDTCVGNLIDPLQDK